MNKIEKEGYDYFIKTVRYDNRGAPNEGECIPSANPYINAGTKQYNPEKAKEWWKGFNNARTEIRRKPKPKIVKTSGKKYIDVDKP